MSDSPLIAVIDDDPALLGLVRHVLGTVGHESLGFTTVEEYLDTIEMDRVACAICDVRMPGLGGLGLLTQIAQDLHAPPVVLLTAHGDAQIAVRALRAGAFGFLEKPFRDQDLLDQVQRALEADGQRRRRRSILTFLQERHEKLTPREREVFQLVVDGAPNRKIASTMDLSQKTVEVHRAHMMSKMSAGSLPGLVRMAVALESAAGLDPLETVPIKTGDRNSPLPNGLGQQEPQA